MLDLLFAKKLYDNFADAAVAPAPAAVTITTPSTNTGVAPATPAAATKPAPAPKSTVAIVLFIIFGIVWLGLCLWAASLSWRSNTAAEWSTFPKVIFSLVAFLNGIPYLFSHLLHKYDLLCQIEKLKVFSAV